MNIRSEIYKKLHGEFTTYKFMIWVENELKLWRAEFNMQGRRLHEMDHEIFDKWLKDKYVFD